MALTINEKWIRERVHLDPENLGDVRSLALPGTYHEKITHLGSALQNFCRLKHLDLSRNALQSLDGLQHLSVLEKLNIYYNNIATLKDLYQLRHNSSLQEVDLRLNPVTKNEPDYRLFMVHMLPNLRKLDDRSVRESERKAALMHFNSDQASELTEHLPVTRQAEADRVTNPRAEMVANLPRKTTVLDEEDCDVLDLIARSGGDLGRPREITGSTAKHSQAATHPHTDHPSRESQDEVRERPTDAEEFPSTKYPPSPSLASTARQADRPRGSSAWDEDERGPEGLGLGDRMAGLELSGGTEGSDNKTISHTFYSPKPNPEDNFPLKSPSILTIPQTPDPYPGVLNPNKSPDIGMSPVISLYHNMSALKTTVIQSYLDDHANNASRLSSVERNAGPASRINDNRIAPPSNTCETKVANNLGKNSTSRDCREKLSSLSPRQNHGVSDQEGQITNGFASPKTRGDCDQRLNKTASYDSVKTGAQVKNVGTLPKALSDMWEYGVPLGIKTNTQSRSGMKKVDANSLHSPQSSTFSRDDKIHSHAVTPVKSPEPETLQSAPQSNPYPSHKILKAASDKQPRRANHKSVSFQETHNPDDINKQSYPVPSPNAALKQPSQNHVSNPSQPPHGCAVMINSQAEPKGSPTQPAGSHTQPRERVRVQFADSETGPSSQDYRNSSVRYNEESQAYTTYTSRGHFTPHPDTNSSGRSQESAMFWSNRLDPAVAHAVEGDTEPTTERVAADPTPPSSVTSATQQMLAGNRVDLNLFLDNFLSLVDRYWNGTKSLHRHGKFQSQAHTLLSTLVNEILATVPQERQDVHKESAAELSKLRQTLRASQDQVESLKDELDAALADKRSLQERLDAVQHEKPSHDGSADRNQPIDRGVRSGVLEREVEKLSRENESLKLHVKHFNQLQELATMLQESHKSLVTTNDHLLQEIDEAKQRHLEEVKQLHWSYSELKRTMELAPNKHGSGRPVDQHHANGIL